MPFFVLGRAFFFKERVFPVDGNIKNAHAQIPNRESPRRDIVRAAIQILQDAVARDYERKGKI